MWCFVVIFGEKFCKVISFLYDIDYRKFYFDNIIGMVFIVVRKIKDVYLELCIRICKYYYGFFYIIKVYKFLFMIVWYYIDDEVCIF